MIYLLALAAVTAWAIPATIVTMTRDGHRRIPTR
jgi:hypothetical protein